jgi:hypothetical protein
MDENLVPGSAFAGVQSAEAASTPHGQSREADSHARISKAEQVFKNRWHLDVELAASQDIDSELPGWLCQAYDLCM